MARDLPDACLPGWRVVPLALDDTPAMQRFFDANPAYFLAVQGEPAGTDCAREELLEEVPAGLSHTRLYWMGWFDAAGDMAAVASVVSDLCAPQVWHIGLFIVATARHGSGDAQALHAGIESWARSHGACWMRLGVVQGNTRAERFWASRGYREVRTRDGIPAGRRTNTVRVMIKPLAGGTPGEYLAMVSRDRPGTP
jgi:GNAT superfamily N-acetyltransferase